MNSKSQSEEYIYEKNNTVVRSRWTQKCDISWTFIFLKLFYKYRYFREKKIYHCDFFFEILEFTTTYAIVDFFSQSETKNLNTDQKLRDRKK